jgi:hypothetical protein
MFFWEILDTVFFEGALVVVGVLLVAFIYNHRTLVFPQECRFIAFAAIHFLICLLLGTADSISFLKQILGVSVSILYYYNIVSHYGTEKVMKLYCNVAFVFACYGVMQEILGLINVPVLVEFDWLVSGMKNEKVLGLFQRCIGFCSEPSFFGMLLLPAFYFAVKRMLGDKEIYSLQKAIVVIVALVCTFSSISYIGAFLAIFLVFNKKFEKYKQNKLKFAGVISGSVLLIGVLCFLAYSFIPEFNMRIDDTFLALRDVKNLNRVNLSSYALISNLHISINMFLKTFGIGVGWGSYGVNYERFSDSLDRNCWMYGINSEDANSMTFRLIGELGVFALIIFLYLFKIRKKTPEQNEDISNAMLLTLLIKFIRLGSYVFGGVMFFFCVYFLCAKGDRSDETIDFNNIIQQRKNNRINNKERGKPTNK